MPLTSGQLAGVRLVLFLALHSSSLAVEKDGLSLTKGKTKTERRRSEMTREGPRASTSLSPVDTMVLTFYRRRILASIYNR